MEFNIRDLNADDIFPVCEIISKIGMEDIQKIMTPDFIANMVDAMHTKKKD